VDNGQPKQREGVEERDRRLNEAEDETLVSYAPAIREALAAREAQSARRRSTPAAPRSDR
jgi:hypothetical protein